MAHKVSDVVFQVTHVPIHPEAHPTARHSSNTISTAETVFYFNPVVTPLLSSYNLLFLHFDFTGAIHTWSPNRKNSRIPPCPWDAAHQRWEGEGRQRRGVRKNRTLRPVAFCSQKENDLLLCSPQENKGPF